MSSISLSWTAATDNVAVTGYNIYRNNAKVGTSSTTSYLDQNLAASTAYSYAVTAFDAAGNESARSATIQVTTTATTPPTTGWPDATNTGIAAGITLSNSNGIEVRTDNAVIKNLRVTGSITVYAMNVTVQDCEVNASGQQMGIGVPDGIGQKNLKVIRCHVYGDGGSNRTSSHVLGGVWGAKEVSYCDIHGCENALVQGCADLYMHDNYLHDFANWPNTGGTNDHTDGLQTYGWAGTGGLRIVHNTILAMETCGDFSQSHKGYGSSAIALSQDQHDLLIDNNFLAGGSYTVYGNAQSGGSPANTKVTNNHFSTMYMPKVGNFGTSSGFASNTTWTGNVIHETGAVVNRA